MSVKDMIRPCPGCVGSRCCGSGLRSAARRGTGSGTTPGAGPAGRVHMTRWRRARPSYNEFVRTREIGSIIEFGCGDGNRCRWPLPQLHRPGRLPDRHRVVPAPVRADPAKSFFLYDGACFTDRAGVFTADLAISLDAIYHLTEDAVFETYLTHLFAAAARFVIIYATNGERRGTAPHVRHRHFTPWVQTHCPDWRLLEVTRGRILVPTGRTSSPTSGHGTRLMTLGV